MSTESPGEWAVDVTHDPCLGFCPMSQHEVVTGLTVIAAKSPGPLCGVFSEHGYEHARQWVSDHPDWRTDYCTPATAE